MSERESIRVKVSLGWLLQNAAKQTARDLDFNISWRNYVEKESSLWYFYQREIDRVYEEFSDAVDALYPGNRQKLEDMIQYLDEQLNELQERRKQVI